MLLERRYSPARGVAMRIRRFRLPLSSRARRSTVKPLIEADLGYQIDNMEGIAVHRNANGETIITLVSDDNFSVIQRNLLLQFALVGVARCHDGLSKNPRRLVRKRQRRGCPAIEAGHERQKMRG